MLESLGYEEAPERAQADLILFNTCSIREAADNRLIAHLGEARRLKREDPARVIGVGGCWAQSLKDEVFERFPFVDVAFGPGQVHRLAEFLTSDSLSAQGYFEFEGFTGELPAKRARPFQGWLQISVGCNCACSYCIVPSTRGREVSRPLEDLLAAGAPRWSPTACARSRCSARTSTPTAATCARSAPASPALLRELDAIDGLERDPLHEPAPQGHARGRDPRARRAALALRAHPPAAAVGLLADPARDAPHLRPRALPRPRRADPRARPRRRADDRHHRRLPGRDRGGLRADAVARRGRSATTAPSPSSSRRAAAPRRRRSPTTVPHEQKVERMERLVEVVQRRARERAQRFVGRTVEVLVEGPSRTDPDRLRGRTRHNKVVNFARPRRAGRARARRGARPPPARRCRGRSGCLPARAEAARRPRLANELRPILVRLGARAAQGDGRTSASPAARRRCCG